MRLSTVTALVLSVSVVLALPAAAQPLDAGRASDDLRGSGYEGGGFQNTLAIGPSGTWLAGGDVAGLSRSVDGGRTWTAANTGLADPRDLRVASIVYAPTSAWPHRVLAGVGNWARGAAAAAGGLLESRDDGLSWRVVSDQVHFSAVDGTDAPHPPPRPTGQLLVGQPDGTLLAGTYDRGVLRSTDRGATWRPLGVGGPVRSLVARPDQPEVLYAADGTGVWRSSGGTFQELAGSPTGVQELTWVAGSLYAAGSKGLHRLDGSRWVRLGAATLSASSVWTSVVGYRACGRTVLYAGSHTGGADSVVRSVDAGRTWHSAVRAAVPTVGGQGGRRWWLADRPYFLLGGPGYTAAQLALPPGSGCDRPVAVAGRSGVWESTAPGSASWYPAVGRLGVTVVNSVAVDPKDPRRTLAASFDWPLVASTDRFGTVSPFQPGQRTGAATGLGTAVAFDPTSTPSTAYLAAGEESTNTRGEVWSSRDPTDPTSWAPTGLAAATGGGLPFALTVVPSPSGPVLLAAVQASGIWRRESGRWSQVPTDDAFDDESRLGGSFASLGDGTVFFWDVNSGLYRSSGYGAGPWKLIWGIRASNSSGGQLAVDPHTPGRLYVSVGREVDGDRRPGLCRIDAAATVQPVAGEVPCTRLLRSARVGPMQVDPRDGSLLVTQSAGTSPAQLCRSGPGGSAPWSDVADDAFRATGGFARSLAVGTDGTVVVAFAGEGVLVGRPGDPSPSRSCAGA